MENMILLRCPFCGAKPSILPEDPVNEGNAWAEVRCTNLECFAQPHVSDGELISDDRGSDAYKASAIEKWNKRASPTLFNHNQSKQ